ncbi:hypothetical protein [Leptospira brenneri]|uniref:Lipoprotein n=1 Tax=Leptospira brenneri TaxID=2023182 RepID=A0A2M9XZM9_9LEPT|nr:hypothetical protein [Leptospira brenneri]PJZ44752.1 hypothetical protein CH361_13970 [Leptospira brenneri]TGK96995.1 hypothetical protein EHQ30_10505 [Leptospira brenneri]
MKKTTPILLTLLFFVTSFANCKAESKEDNTPLLAFLLYTNDQLSGNCAIVTKNSATSYSVSITPTPKGACKVDRTKAEVEATYNTTKNNIIAYYTKAGSVCDSSVTSITNGINTQITNSNNTNDATFEASVASKRAFSVPNLVVETAAKLKNDGRTEAQIAATSPTSLDDYFYVAAVEGSSTTACANALKAMNQTLIDAVTSTPPTKLIFSTCTYGSAEPATTKCATLNTEF